MISRFVLEAIDAIDPNTCADVTGDDTDTIRFFQNPSNITVEQVIAKIPAVEAEYDAQAYARNRALTYPNMGDQMDKIYHDGLTKWKSEMVDPVKTKWPKDNSGPVE